MLDATASHHLVRVLRLSPGDPVQLFNGQGQEGPGVILQADPLACQVRLDSLVTIQRESPVRTLILQSLCLADKMDWVVQKASELGGAEIWPVRAARSQLQLSGDRAAKRVEHWQRIAQAAAAQCGRNQVPLVRPIQRLQEALIEFERGPRSAAAHPRCGWMLDPFALKTVSQAPITAEIWIAIGPEAGWTDEEEDCARRAGFEGLRLGPRVLRTETVAAAILSVVAARAGEF